MLHLLAQTPPPDPPPAADPGQVTTAWMAGVVGIMLLFGVIALVGYVRQRSSMSLQKDNAE